MVLALLLTLTASNAGGYGLEAQCRAGDGWSCAALCAQEVQVCDKDGGTYDKEACNTRAAEVPACPDSPTPGTLCTMPVTQLRPTQGAVGQFVAQCKSDKLEKKGKKSLPRYLAARPVPTVLGPGRAPYLTDRHHLSTALLNADIDADRKEVFACITADYSDLKQTAFWQTMKHTHSVWLRDGHGRPIKPTDLPAGLAQLQDDPYRSLSRWVRDSCGYIKCGKQCGGDEGPDTSELLTCQLDSVAPYFLEFAWSDYLRKQLPLEGVYEAEGPAQAELLRSRLEAAMALANQPQAAQRGLPGWNGALIQPRLVSFDPETGCDL